MSSNQQPSKILCHCPEQHQLFMQLRPPLISLFILGAGRNPFADVTLMLHPSNPKHFRSQIHLLMDKVIFEGERYKLATIHNLTSGNKQIREQKGLSPKKSNIYLCQLKFWGLKLSLRLGLARSLPTWSSLLRFFGELIKNKVGQMLPKEMMLDSKKRYREKGTPKFGDIKLLHNPWQIGLKR